MTALELRDDEIGVYDPVAYKAVRERLYGKPKPVSIPPARDVLDVSKPKVVLRFTPPAREPAPVSRDDAAAAYPIPIGPCRPGVSYERAPIKMRDIIKIVAHVYRVPLNCLLSDRRDAAVVRPRQELMWLAKRYTSLSLPAIGRALDRDHTTVLHAIRKIDGLIAEQGYTPRAEGYVSDWCVFLNARIKPAAKKTPIVLAEPVSVPPPPSRSTPVDPPKYSTGRIWRENELSLAREMVADGWTMEAIASHLGRSRSAVVAALWRNRADAAIAAE